MCITGVKDEEKMHPLYTADANINWCHFRKQYRGFYKIKFKKNYYMIQQSHFWFYVQKN